MSVTAVALPAFLPGPDAEINAVDLAAFRDLLETEFKSRPIVRIVPAPKSPVPDLAILEGVVTQYRVTDQPAERLFLRTIDLALELRIRAEDGKAPPRVLARRLSYQKIYLPGQTAPAREFDFRFAAKEVAKQMVAGLLPDEDQTLELERAVDQGSGADWSTSNLLRGNWLAAHGHSADAELVWSLLLYDPAPDDRKGLFRITDRVLSVLGQRETERAIVDVLRPLQRFKPMEGAQFLGRVRDALGGASPFESLVLYLSRLSSESVHLNIAATHRNLARLYKRQKRLELASYHLSRSFVHYPRGEVWDEWVKLQAEREMPTPNPAEALEAALRIPAPRSALVSVTAFDRIVLPPPALPEPGGAAAAAGVPAGPVLPSAAPPNPEAAPAAPTAPGGAAPAAPFAPPSAPAAIPADAPPSAPGAGGPGEAPRPLVQ
jgi:hypothetical protein